MKKLLIISFLIFSTISRSYSQWSVINVGTSSNLYSVDYCSANDIWIGGSNVIAKTNNGGSSWSLISPLLDSYGMTISSSIYDINYYGSSSAMMVGKFYFNNDAIVFNTTNDGASWNVAYSITNGSNPRYFNSMDKRNSVCLAVGYSGMIVRSTNSGSSWSGTPTVVSSMLYDVKFASNDTVFAVGANTILRSVNGGQNWASAINTSNTILNVSCARNVVYFGYSSSALLKSTDYGISATTLNLPFSYSGIISAINKDTIIIAGTNGLYISKDGAQYWEMFDLPTYKPIKMIDFLGNNRCIAVGDLGYVIKTDNIFSAPTLPVASFNIQGGATNYCLNDSATFINTTAPLPGYSYEWRIDNVLFSNSFNCGLRLTDFGQHTVSLTVTNSYGSNTATRQVNVIGHNINPIILITSGDTICNGTKAYFSISNTQTGVVYSLRNGYTIIGSSQNGNGGTLTFVTTSALTSSTTFNIKALKITTCFTDSIVEYRTIYVKNTYTPVTACTPAVHYCANSGITNFTFNSINNNTSTLFNNYFNYTCCQHTVLYQNHNYPVSVSVSNPTGEYVGVWIDYNNNGQFSATEKVLYGFANPTLTGNIAIPISSNINQNLRLRIVSDVNSAYVDAACPSQTYTCGQIEDYSVTLLKDTMPPIPSFTFSYIKSCNSKATFTNTTYNGDSFLWDFGDGQTSTLQTPPIHYYPDSGSFIVELIATNTYGSDTITDTIINDILWRPATAVCNPTGLSGSGLTNIYAFYPDMVTSTISDNTCTYQFMFEVDTTYKLNYNTPYPYSIVYFDYNGDGVFSQYEAYNCQGSCLTNSFDFFSLRIPPYAKTNFPIRMRIISANQCNSMACSSYSGGGCYQDYNIMFLPHPDSPVYPGDANADQFISQCDVLLTRLYDGYSGIPRSSFNNTMEACKSLNWDTIQPLTNRDLKHVDCNGDGVINNDDTLAISNNFSTSHNKIVTEDDVQINEDVENTRSNLPPWYIRSSSTVFNAGDWVDLDIILGDSINPVNNFYGIAFLLRHNFINGVGITQDLIEPGSLSVNYNNSWLGTIGNSLSYFFRDKITSQHFCLTRTNHDTINGYGKIASIHFRINPVLPHVQFSVSLNTYDSYCSAKLFNLIDNFGNKINVANPISFIGEVNPVTVSINENNTSKLINIYPNPSNDIFTISFYLDKKSNVKLELFNSIGQKIETLLSTTRESGSNNFQFNARDKNYGEGVYFMKIIIGGVEIMKKVVVIK